MSQNIEIQPEEQQVSAPLRGSLRSLPDQRHAKVMTRNIVIRMDSRGGITYRCGIMNVFVKMLESHQTFNPLKATALKKNANKSRAVATIEETCHVLSVVSGHEEHMVGF